MAELKTINESGELTRINLGGTDDGDKLLTSDEIEAKIPAAGVPYTGATTNVDLGDNTLDTKRLLQSNNGNSIFIGEDAGLNDDLTDNNNVLVGHNAGVNNTGTHSNGFGYSALQDNSGTYSNGFGASTLSNNSGAYSNGFGDNALQENIGAYSNGFGANALQENTGIYSNGFGAYALQYNTGANNTAVGHNTSNSNPFAYTNTTALGYNVQPNASNQVMLGDANVTDVWMGQNGQAKIHGIIAATAPTTVTTATYTVLSTDKKLHVTYAGACTITIPTALITDTFDILIKDGIGDAGTNNITIASEGSQTFDGAANLVMATNYMAKNLYSDGTNLFIY